MYIQLTRNDLTPAIYRPGMYAGTRGNRSQNEWQADAIIEYLKNRKLILDKQ